MRGGVPGKVRLELRPGRIVGADKQEPSAEDMAKNFDATREQLLGDQREEIFRIYLGTLSQKYEKGGGIKYTKAAAAPAIPGMPPARN